MIKSFFIYLIIFSSSFAFSKDNDGNANEIQLTYPELSVVPLASQRLDMEAKSERDARWTMFLPLQVSGLMTIVAGSSLAGEDHSSYDADKKSLSTSVVSTSYLVGGATIGLSLLLHTMYFPYEKGQQQISKMPSGKMSDNLTKERMAEEEIHAAGAMGKRITWISVLTNASMSGLIISSANKDARIMGGLSLLASVSPLVFPFKWQKVSRLHNDYKKRIYGPVVSTGFIQTNKDLSPGLLVSYQF